MKSFFTALTLIFSLVLIPAETLAQRSPPNPPDPISCPNIDRDNYDTCCSNENYGVNRNACDEYLATVNNGAPTTPGNTTGEIITVPNNFGMCNSYRWDGTKWVKINVNPFMCNQGSGDECSIIDDFNYQNCCIERTGNAIQCKKYTDAGGMGLGGSGIFGTGDPNTNPITSGTSSTAITPTPQASSAALSSCNAIAFESILDILIWLRCVIAAAIIPLIFTLAFLFFLWGMVMYIRGSDDVKKREESKKFIYWGIIGLTVMVSIWGIVQIVNSTFGFGNAVPTLQTKDNCLTTDPNNPCKK